MGRVGSASNWRLSLGALVLGCAGLLGLGTGCGPSEGPDALPREAYRTVFLSQVFFRDAAKERPQEVARQAACRLRNVPPGAADYLLDQREAGGGNLAEHASTLGAAAAGRGIIHSNGSGSFRVRRPDFHGAA